MRPLVLAVALLFAVDCAAQPPVPAAVAERKAPEGLEGLVWNKWDAGSFVVISLDKSRGSSLRREIEPMREELLSRWGIAPQRTAPCKVVLVPDARMLKRLFGLSVPRCEVRKSGTNSSDSAIWIDDERMSLLPSLMAECELLNGDFRSFARRGVPLLERSASHARDDLLASTDSPLSAAMADAKTESEASALARNSALVCLLVRKEFGPRAFGSAARGGPQELHAVLGFSTAQELERTYARYRQNLLGDLKAGRTPDEYLRAGH